MCPSLNRQALKDPDAVEKLIVRQLPRPSARTVWVGDVVAFNSPLGKPSESQVMVRRVAAVEGMDMVAEGDNKDAEEEEFQIPPVSTKKRWQSDDCCWILVSDCAAAGLTLLLAPDFFPRLHCSLAQGHCWVLADNPDMKPPQVIDSRTFGFIPMSNILGRVIYAGSSPTEHAPVINSPLAQAVDDPILEQEVLIAGVFSSESEGGSKSENEK